MLPAPAPVTSVRFPETASPDPNPHTLAVGDDPSSALDRALALLRHAGAEPPDGPVDSPAYLHALIGQLVDLSSRDPLTGLSNRRSFEMALARELDRVARSGEAALLLMVDVDHFKRLCDRHGPEVSDQVVHMVGQALSESVRPMDLVGRVSDEAFAVMLPNCQAAFGPQIAARLRFGVARSSVMLPNGHALGVTVSIGGAFAPQWVRSSARVWMQRADLQLYRAKTEGRDRVCFEPVLAPEVSADEKQLLMGSLSLPQTT
jgi:diguanylate cyclase (GGDEF)-like protein